MKHSLTNYFLIPGNYVIIMVLSAFLSVNIIQPACADTLEVLSQGSEPIKKTSRDIVLDKLVNIGYSRTDASEAIKELSTEELDYLAKNPKLIKRKGIIIIVLACIGITFLVIWTAEEAAKL